MINVLPIELNWIIRIINIKPNDDANAVIRKLHCFHLIFLATTHFIDHIGNLLKLLIAFNILALTSLGYKA
jgi:hypothetical protein